MDIKDNPNSRYADAICVFVSGTFFKTKTYFTQIRS